MIVLTLLLLFIQKTMGEVDQRVITTLKYSTYRVKPTIVDGFPTGNSRVPYLVSIKEPASTIATDTMAWINLCGGSIISPNRVLTAAHCFEGSNYFYFKNPGRLRLMAGSNQTMVQQSGHSETRPDLQVRSIARVVLNQNFNFPSNDIALVFTNKPWNYTDEVDFITTARRGTDYVTCISAGYGKIGNDDVARTSPVLLIANIHVLTRWHCNTLWNMNMNSFVCSDSVFGDVSKGDSGGPLACYGTGDPNEIPGKEVLVGIVSGKNFDMTTLFTRVSYYKDWIETDDCTRLTPRIVLLVIIPMLLIYLLFSL